MRFSRPEIALIVLVLAESTLANAQSLPTKEYTCAKTTVDHLEWRLRDGKDGPFIPDTGSAIRFKNGGYQVSYFEEKAVQQSRPGDPVLMCLVKTFQNCPADNPSTRIYTTTNLRTFESWTMMDRVHGCVGE